MQLADDIRALRDRTLVAWTAAHDYYADSVFAWQLLTDAVLAGQPLAHVNPVTGTASAGADLAARSAEYVERRLAESTFQQFLSIFETFVFDFLCLWVKAYPQSVAKRQVEFQTVLDAPDKDAIVDAFVGKEVAAVLYDRPTAWFAYLEDRVKLGVPSRADIDIIAEAKASRDVLIHNAGVANALYLSKAGPLARYAAGERIDIPEPYHGAVWRALCKVAGEVADAAVARLGPEPKDRL